MEWPALSAAASTLATFATKLFASELDTVVINCQEDSKEETVSQLKRLREEHPNMPHRKWKAFAEKRFKKLRCKGVNFLTSHGGHRDGEDDGSDEVEEESVDRYKMQSVGGRSRRVV